MKRWKSLTAALCAAVLLCGFTAVPAYAYADGGAGSNHGDPTMETPAPEPTIEPGLFGGGRFCDPRPAL